jgi:lipoyl(octanoyl) transferase
MSCCTHVLLFVILNQFLLTQASKLVRVLNLCDRCVPFSVAWEWQSRLMEHQISMQDDPTNSIVGHVIMLQHNPVYTLGTASEEKSGPFSAIAKDGTQLEYDTFHVERAGQATYHGPGQITMYPILDLNHFARDINYYLRGLEEIIIRTLQLFNISGDRKEGLTGVWVGARKVAAIGIKLRRWVTMHGIALNVNPDLRYFDNIVPCGITDDTLSVGSITEWNEDLDIMKVSSVILDEFANYFSASLDEIVGDEAERYMESFMRISDGEYE